MQTYVGWVVDGSGRGCFVDDGSGWMSGMDTG